MNANSLSADTITSLHQDRARPHILWVGTTSGLNEFDKRTKTAKRYQHNEEKPNPTGISHNHITHIHEDRAGALQDHLVDRNPRDSRDVSETQGQRDGRTEGGFETAGDPFRAGADLVQLWTGMIYGGPGMIGEVVAAC